MHRFAMLALLLAVIAAPALADVPSPSLCTIDMEPYAATLFTVPDGSGNPFTDARFLGDPVDATLTITVVNASGDPIVNYPAADIWFEGTGFVPCSGAHPDSDTDQLGQARWTAPLAGGGSTAFIQAMIAGDPLPVATALSIVSPDMTGDLMVNLGDITLFTQALDTYSFGADFNADGQIDLSDISLMAQAIGAACP